MTMAPEDLERRQECLASAILHMVEIVQEMAEQTGFSPAKRLKNDVLLLLDGVDLTELHPEIPPPIHVPDDDEDDESE